MKQEALKELYLDELRDIYNAENQILKALPKMVKAASSEDLRAGFEKHLEQTRGQVQRLDTIFRDLGEKSGGKKCKGMEGVLAEGAEVMDEDYDDEVMDAALISAAQRVEHYEMAAYGCVRTYAELLGETKAAELLEETLEEEKETDEKLTELAGNINVEAMGNSESSDEEEDEDVKPAKRSRTAKA